MKYKTITVVEKISFNGNIYENSMDEIKPFLEEGYRIVNVSSNNIIRPNLSQVDQTIEPSILTLISTYLLELKP